ncbi:nitroreductase family protein [Flavobacterium dauae]|uniref:nitroreductase family protein n=1 Tax=Flavobacterium dauae TaxID=1563479 RepID=UPI00101B37FC|nr:nitroreductase family protein [Flavobacterium dauae]WLD24007.1 nitroreductase family protein [Flavobacterium dauae]
MELINALNWRYATKKMSGEKVAEEKVNQIIEAAYLAPTSSGLQPFEIIAISNEDLRKKIQPIAYGQTQIVDGSHLLVFASWNKYTDERIDSMFNHMNTERGLPLNTTDEYKTGLKAQLFALPEQQQAAHTAKQSYIAFGTAIAAAAMVKVDATPMEGFVNEQLDELLGLNEKGLKSQAILALGYRAAEGDWLQGMKKVRHPKEKFLTEIK